MKKCFICLHILNKETHMTEVDTYKGPSAICITCANNIVESVRTSVHVPITYVPAYNVELWNADIWEWTMKQIAGLIKLNDALIHYEDHEVITHLIAHLIKNPGIGPCEVEKAAAKKELDAVMKLQHAMNVQDADKMADMYYQYSDALDKALERFATNVQEGQKQEQSRVSTREIAGSGHESYRVSTRETIGSRHESYRVSTRTKPYKPAPIKTLKEAKKS